MSMAMRGVTHCSECGSPLGMGEFGICQQCVNERNNKVKEERKKEIQYRIAELQKELDNLNKE